jgi:hypothetical protein
MKDKRNGAFSGMKTGKENQITQRISASLPLYAPLDLT